MLVTPEYLKKERDAEWRAELRKSIKNKERTLIDRVLMPELEPMTRAKSQNKEVNTGLSVEQAVKEAVRCLDCANPTCIGGCPVGINIPKFIKNIERQEFGEAIATLKETNALPAVCGRVCPQEKQCEAECFYFTKLDKEPVAIGYLERFAADYERESGKMAVPEAVPRNGVKVAAVGSGPASLSFAGEMIKRGFDVTVFEALHEIGGVLKYGIPEFRLPNTIVDTELDILKKMGVKFETNFIVGRTASFDKLREEGFKAFFIGSGAGLPRFMNIPGENSNGVLSANEYLTRVNLMGADDDTNDTPVLYGKNVAIIGGGNTAIDSVRTAKRLGAKRAAIIYRRSEREMPARIEEIKHAKEEGIEFYTLCNPVKYKADENGRVKGIELIRMELGKPDDSGRRRPIAVEGSEFEFEADIVIIAVGVSPNPLVPECLPSLKTSSWGTIVVDENKMQSSEKDMFAGGDIVRGGATVILAMGDGRKAAENMHNYLKEKNSLNKTYLNMSNLSVSYLGIEMRNPLIAGSCGLTNSIDNLRKIEKAGAGAIVLKSIFEEEIYAEYAEEFSKLGPMSNNLEFLDYYDYKIRENNLARYLTLIKNAKKEINIPIIASINCLSSQEWPFFAQKIEEAGADAIELNIFILPSNISQSGEENEKTYFDIISGVALNAKIPVSVKISPHLSSLGKMIKEISFTEAKGLVLFNRFYSPDIDIKKESLITSNPFSHPDEYILPLRWVGMMSNRINCDLISSTGIHNWETVVKMLLAGATAVQVVSAMYIHGIPVISKMIQQLALWMKNHHYSDIKSFRGKLSLENSANPSDYERVQYMRHFGSDKFPGSSQE